MKNVLFLLTLTLSFLLTSCNDDLEYSEKYYSEEDQEVINRHLNLPNTPYSYNIKYPEYITTFVNTNIDYDKATLGRVLFYDKSLSSDKSVSCASCHKQELAFSDDVAFSPGAEGKVTTRNSLALGSVINFRLYYGSEVFTGIPFFWDNSAATIQEQSQRTLANPNEMNMHITQVHSRVNSIEYYKPLIKKAFNTEIATGDQILDAIAEFTNSITNYNTKFDNGVAKHYKNRFNTNIEGVNLQDFTALENKGKDVYLTNCAPCHGTVAGRPGKTESNNGLYMDYKDKGAAVHAGGSPRFKVPTLRNVMLTAPYMHDGSLATIDDVIEHYSKNIKNTVGLDPLLRSNNQALKMNLTEDDKSALKAFLSTMTDEKVISDVKFSDPFIR